MPNVVLFTPYAPYLGGPQTWHPLRAHLPSDWVLTEIDPLAFAGADVDEATAALRAHVVSNTDLLIAHGYASGPAIDAVADAEGCCALLLLSPSHVGEPPTRKRRVLRAIVRVVVESRFLSRLLNAYARKKLRHLRSDRAYVRKQLQLLVSDAALSEQILEEACRRVADPRVDLAIEKTDESMRQMIRALLASTAHEKVQRIPRLSVIIGSHEKSRERFERTGIAPIHVVNGGRLAPMLEDPILVARVAQELLA